MYIFHTKFYVVGRHVHRETMKTRLKSKYGDRIIFVSKKGGSMIITFADAEYLILRQSWIDSFKNEDEEKKKMLLSAAALIRNDIHLQEVNNNYYPPSNTFLNNVNISVPESLKFFIKEIILQNKKGNLYVYETKCTAIYHSILCAVRPKSFLSPLQLGLAVMLHRKFGSKRIVDIFSRLGMCSSYKEATHYQDCLLLSPPTPLNSGCFVQFAFDNADFNINTIDGKNTLHSMAGI